MVKYEVGQRLVATRPYGRSGDPEPVVVVKVGRKLVTAVAPGFEDTIRNHRVFEIETGAERRPGGYMGGALYTPEEWAQKHAKAELLQRIRQDHGVSIHGRLGRCLSLAQVQAIAAIMDEAAS